jgi:nitrile hydratase accessory protein
MTPVAPESNGLAARPVFAKPWHATVFGLVVSLHSDGRFSWPDWVAAYARRDQASPDRAGECVEDGYYRRVLETLQDILAAQDQVTSEALRTMDDAWRRAYLATPHGEPVELENALAGTVRDDHKHGHTHHHGTGAALRPRLEPVAISPARH